MYRYPRPVSAFGRFVLLMTEMVTRPERFAVIWRRTMEEAVLIGIDVGPNLSITGSLATILWLVALRRENITVSAGQFLKLGAMVMTVPLLLAIGSLFLLAH